MLSKLSPKHLHFINRLILIFLLVINVLQFCYIIYQKQLTNSLFFKESRINRDQITAKSFSALRVIIDDPNSSPETKKALTDKLQTISTNLEMENKLETALKGKGFTDSFVQLYDGRAIIFIKTGCKAMKPDKLNMIRDLAYEYSNIKDIEIVPK